MTNKHIVKKIKIVKRVKCSTHASAWNYILSFTTTAATSALQRHIVNIHPHHWRRKKKKSLFLISFLVGE